MNGVCYQLVGAYVQICCFSLSEDAFVAILSPDVELHHQTNGETPVVANGREPVAALFKKYIFENTSNVDLKSIELHDCNKEISLRLLVEEDKAEEGAVHRYLFEEKTNFQFAEGKIRSISTTVKRVSSKGK